MTTPDWRDALPRKRMGSGALVRDLAGRVLVVQPTYKTTWELPGGIVEADESPRAACAREIVEELGLVIEPGRLLCIEWQGPEPDRSESVMFIYDGGILAADAEIRLPDDELSSFRFVPSGDLDQLMSARVARRCRAAVIGVEEDRLVELEHGVAVPHRRS